MKKIVLLLFFTLTYSQGFSQNTFFIGEKTYPCSETYTLGFFHPKLEIVFIKNREQGMIAVTTDAHLGTQRIKGKLTIYLDNNTTITCLDRNKFDVVNHKSTTIYYLTKEEVNKLKYNNITSIRYTVGCIKCYGMDSSDNYSVENKAEKYVSEKIDFPSVIRNLF